MNNKRMIANLSLALGIGAVGVASWSVVGRGTKVAASTATVVTAQTGNVLSSVTGTGNVIAPAQASVGFDSAVSSNKVISVAVNIGDKVTAGQVLAKVDDTTVAQALAAAQAQLASAQAALDKAQNAVTPEIVAQDAAGATQSSLSVQSAQAGVTNAQNTLDGDTTSQDAAVAQSQQAYNVALVLMPRIPRGDYNRDQQATVADIFAFLTDWFAGAPGADWGGNGTITVTDIFEFLADWFSGG